MITVDRLYVRYDDTNILEDINLNLPTGITCAVIGPSGCGKSTLLNVYFDPYVKQHYLHADAHEKAMFAELVEQEDPDLLDWFMEVSAPPRPELLDFIHKLKKYVHGE